MAKHLFAFITASAFIAACGAPPDDPGSAPPPVVDTVEIEGPTGDLFPGDTIHLTARAYDTDGEPVGGRTFTWESVPPTVATVGTDGRVTALAPGEVTIYATTGDVTGGVFLTVIDDDPPPVARVELSQSGETELDIGATLQLVAITYAANGEVLADRSILWTSSSSATATVMPDGMVTAIAAGMTTITAESGGQRDTLTVRVIDDDPPVPVDHVTLDYLPITLAVGETVQLTAQPRDAQGQPLARPVTWSSNNPAYVSVSDAGLVTALDVGGADIVATSEGKSAQVRVWSTFTTGHTLAAVGGAALPALLGSFPVNLPEGGTALLSVRINDGSMSLDHNSRTFEVILHGTQFLSNALWGIPVPVTYETFGTFEQHPTTQQLVFTPLNFGAPFTGSWAPTGLQVHWQPDVRITGEATFLFTNQ